MCVGMSAAGKACLTQPPVLRRNLPDATHTPDPQMPRIPPLSAHPTFLHGARCSVKMEDLLGRLERDSQLSTSRSLRVRLVGDRLQERGGVEQERDGAGKNSHLCIGWDGAGREVWTRAEPEESSCQHGRPRGRWHCLFCHMLSDQTGVCDIRGGQVALDCPRPHFFSLLSPTP